LPNFAGIHLFNMKHIFFYSALLFLTACGNNSGQQNENAVDTTATHLHETHEQATDTAVIASTQRVFFANLTDGQEIKLPFVVKFGVEGMEVEPAVGVNPNKGHHHLLIDKTAVPAGTMVPMGQDSEGYFHFGKGQTSDTLNLKKYPMLTPGKHVLRLQFANGLHSSYGQGMSTAVSIVVR